jgi:flagellar biogenesis protein FliO
MIDGAILQTFGTLLVLTVLLGGGLLLIKKFSKNSKAKSNGIDIQIISKIGLQPKTNLIVVKAGLKTLLIGTTDHNVSILADLTEDVRLMQHGIKRSVAPRAKEPIVDNQSIISPDDVRRAILMQNQSIAKQQTPSLSFGSFLKSAFSRG